MTLRLERQAARMRLANAEHTLAKLQRMNPRGGEPRKKELIRQFWETVRKDKEFLRTTKPIPRIYLHPVREAARA